ncbi:MAG: hypothetical protein U1F45_00800 [Burkholderiales bacterium]
MSAANPPGSTSNQLKSPLKTSVGAGVSCAASARIDASAKGLPYSPPIAYSVSASISGGRRNTSGEYR